MMVNLIDFDVIMPPDVRIYQKRKNNNNNNSCLSEIISLHVDIQNNIHTIDLIHFIIISDGFLLISIVFISCRDMLCVLLKSENIYSITESETRKKKKKRKLQKIRNAHMTHDSVYLISVFIYCSNTVLLYYMTIIRVCAHFHCTLNSLYS